MNKEQEIIMAINNIYNKVAWLNRLKLVEKIKDKEIQLYTSSEMFCVEYIGKNTDSKGADIAEACFMTRSALSKVTKKLVVKGIIERYQKPSNKKEIYFKLTEKGMDIYNLHEEMTNNFLERDKVIFEKMSKEEISTIISFFDIYNNHLDHELKEVDAYNK